MKMTVDEALAVVDDLGSQSFNDMGEPQLIVCCEEICDLRQAHAVLSELATDAKRWEHARKLLTIDDIELAHEAWEAFGRLTSEYECLRADTAMDKAIAASVVDNQEQTK